MATPASDRNNFHDYAVTHNGVGGDFGNNAAGQFAQGTGQAGPAAIPQANNQVVTVNDPGQVGHPRSSTVGSGLSDEAQARIDKVEAKEAKRIIKVTKNEGKLQKKHLDAAIKDLSSTQKSQKKAVKKQESAIKDSTSASKHEHKLHQKLIDVKATYEKALANATAKLSLVDSTKKHAQEQTDLLAKKTKEVETLRNQKSLDDRQRTARIEQLSAIGKK